MADQPKQGISIDDFVDKLYQLPPDKQKEVMSQLSPEAQQQVGAYIQQKYGQPQGVAKAEGAPKKEKKPKEPIGKKIENTVHSIDSLVGTTARTAATTSVVGGMAPAIAFDPIGGTLYATLLGATTYFVTNISYKVLSGSIKLSYNIIRHPLDYIGKAFEQIKEFATNPLEKIKTIFATPKNIFDWVTKSGGSNKYGKVLGILLGGGIALHDMIPGSLDSTISSVAPLTDTVAESAKSGFGVLAEKGGNLIDTLKETVSNYMDKLYVNNPFESLSNGMNYAYESVVYK